ncbi:hypothetical protein FRC07_011765, partial [Ceratobasidium sp. 392]
LESLQAYAMNNPTTIQAPTTWPEGYEHTLFALSELRARPLREGESWSEDILTLITIIFPAAAPQCFVWRPHYNLRHPLNNPEDKQETGRLEPDFVITHGPPGSQRIVAAIEIKNSPNISQEDSDRFLQYCRQIEAFDPQITLGTTMLLIAGGVAYAWNRDDVAQLLDDGFIDNDRLRAMEGTDRSAVVNEVGFLALLAGIRNRFVASLGL